MRRIVSTSARFREALERFGRDDKAVTSIEYAVIAAGIGGLVIVAVHTLGDTVRETLFERVATRVQEGVGSGGQD